MKIKYATICKSGNRSNNEDAYQVVSKPEQDQWLGIVCDGMGGHAMGELASETVVHAIADFWSIHHKGIDSEEKVREAFALASQQLDARASSMLLKEMGTTLVMASIQKDTMTIVHTGDSRCYVIRPKDELLYQTKDHTTLNFGWEIVSKCFFSFKPEAAVPEIKQIKLRPGDRILLCSDGIYKSMPPEILKARMMDNKSPEQILDVFDFLCEKNGDDNYTAILAIVE